LTGTSISCEEVKDKDFRKEASCINLIGRRYYPPSCTEVATSGIYNFKTGIH
jgi:hypothetical protein